MQVEEQARQAEGARPDASAVQERSTAGQSRRAEAPYWREMVARYERPRLGRSMLDLATSVLPYAALSIAMYLSLGGSYLLTLAIAVPAAGFLLRTYIIFHDCTHGSFLPSKRANQTLGKVLGVIVYSPFVSWRHNHAVHHATAGDLDRRGVGDVPTLTVAEYRARAWRGRLAYRLFRNPIVMFGVGSIFAMVISPRLVSRTARPRIRRSVIATNVVLLALVGVLCWLLGWREYLLVQGPTALLAGATGVWLFYVQHQFEDTYWQSTSDWSYAQAALRGSSHLKLPRVLQFFTGNIGLHHVHHLSARIPNYNLQRAHDENAIFHDVPTLSLWDGLRAVRLKLWDEDSGRLLSFAQVREAGRVKPEAGRVQPAGAEVPDGSAVRAVSAPWLDRFASAVVTGAPPILLGLGMWLGWSGGLFAWGDVVVLVVSYVVIGTGVTVGFHRLLTHRSFRCNRWLRALFAILGSAAAEGPVIDWVATHRKHHQFSDLDGDPHSPHVGFGSGWVGALRGLAHAHLGWVFSDMEVADERRYAKDLLADPLIRFVDRTFVLWVLAGLAGAFGLGVALSGSVAGGLTGLLWGGAARIFLLHHATFSINSLCHFFGKRDFETGDQSRNLAWLAIPTWGEAWHNNHHAFPTSFRHGFRRWQIDPSAAVIRMLELMGLAWDVVRVDPSRKQRLGSPATAAAMSAAAPAPAPE